MPQTPLVPACWEYISIPEIGASHPKIVHLPPVYSYFILVKKLLIEL